MFNLLGLSPFICEYTWVSVQWHYLLVYKVYYYVNVDLFITYLHFASKNYSAIKPQFFQ